MTAPTIAPVYTGPGVYDDMPATTYHADPVPGGSLSSSGARKLLACPEKYLHERTHGQAHRPEFDFGAAAHKLVLGDGPTLARIDYDDWRSKAAKDAVTKARAAGAVPLKPDDYDAVHAMADKLRAHPVASSLFAPGSGRPEVSLFWTDPATGVTCRARPDWLPHPSGKRLLLPDYKTTTDAGPDGFRKSIENFGYHMQAAWYLDAVRALGLDPHGAEFLLVAQEKTPPYLINIIGIEADWLAHGRAKNAAAREMYRDCADAGVWPGYGTDPTYLSQPAWAAIRDEETYL